MANIDRVLSAYRHGEGAWSGCNWPTRFGSLGLNLDGVTSAQARRAAVRWLDLTSPDLDIERSTTAELRELAALALQLHLLGPGCRRDGSGRSRPAAPLALTRRPCAAVLAWEWEVAASVLAEIEADARSAEREARAAVRAAGEGDWELALRRARCACAIESGYHAPRPWQRLRRAIARAASERQGPDNFCRGGSLPGEMQ